MHLRLAQGRLTADQRSVRLGRVLARDASGLRLENAGPRHRRRPAVALWRTGLAARNTALGESENPMEACFDRGWTDGLPVMPPTPARVPRMRAGTTRRPDGVQGLVPPDLAPCTMEKGTINAVMAGCKPEYLPVVLAAVDAALVDEFGMHGILCTEDKIFKRCFSFSMAPQRGRTWRPARTNLYLEASEISVSGDCAGKQRLPRVPFTGYPLPRSHIHRSRKNAWA